MSPENYNQMVGEALARTGGEARVLAGEQETLDDLDGAGQFAAILTETRFRAPSGFSFVIVQVMLHVFVHGVWTGAMTLTSSTEDLPDAVE